MNAASPGLVELIDTHVHLASADEILYPRASTPRFVTEAYVFEPEQLIEGMDGAGVAQAIVVQPFGIYGTDNGFQASASQRWPGRLVSVCGLDPDESAPSLLRHWVLDRGMSGGRISTLGAGMDLASPGFVDLAEVHSELGVPLCLLTTRRYLGPVALAAQRSPATNFVIDHLGVPGDVPAADVVLERLSPLLDLGNVYFKISTALLVSSEGTELLHALVARAGGSRVVWGSNYPVTDRGGYEGTVGASRRVIATLPESERVLVATDAARALWPKLTSVSNRNITDHEIGSSK